MTDRELLELTAKAAGLEIVRSRLDDPLCADMLIVGSPRNKHSSMGPWNPLTDDGDALRLAVTLGLVVCVMNEPGFTGVYLPAERIGGKYDEVEHHGNDPYAATRRAITRAAASIGRGEG